MLFSTLVVETGLNSLDQSLPRNYDPVHLLFHRSDSSDSSYFDIYSFLRPLIIRAGHLRWKLTKLVSTFGKKLITITDVLIADVLVVSTSSREISKLVREEVGLKRFIQRTLLKTFTNQKTNFLK